MPSIPTPDRVVRLARDQAGAGVRLARDQAGAGVRLARDSAEALVALPGALVSLTRAVRHLDVTVRDARDTVVRLQRVGERLEGVLDEVEQPLKDLAPGLRRVGDALDDPAVSELPDTVRRVREDLLPLAATLRGGADVLDRFAGARSFLGGLRRPEPPPLPVDPPDTPPVMDRTRGPVDPPDTPPAMDRTRRPVDPPDTPPVMDR